MHLQFIFTGNAVEAAKSTINKVKEYKVIRHITQKYDEDLNELILTIEINDKISFKVIGWINDDILAKYKEESCAFFVLP